MLIKAGVEVPSVANMIEIVRLDAKRRVDITVLDSNGSLVDIEEAKLPNGDPKGELELTVTDLNNTTIYEEAYYPREIPPKTRIKHGSTGAYYMTFGTEDDETENAGTILFNWHARINDTTEDMYRTQVVEIVHPRTLALLPKFRLLIDKVVKNVQPSQNCFLGYTDGMLICFLTLGLHMLNEYEPYPMWSTLQEYPIEYHSDILLKAALYVGLISQTLFAIDTDVPSFSDQGHSFVLQHAAPLAAFIQNLRAELDKLIPIFKLKFVNSGTIGLEVRMNAAYYTLLTSAPTGSIFRSYWLSQPN
jgi:hypothetical protein